MKKPPFVLGKNQQFIFDILSDLSFGRNIKDIRYYGGSVSNGERCISIGRECALFYDISWEIVDLRHAGEIFRQAHVGRLGTSCQRSFNRALHGFVRKKWIIPLPADFITLKGYKKPDWRDKIYMGSHDGQRGYMRFVIIAPNAFSTEKKDKISC